MPPGAAVVTDLLGLVPGVGGTDVPAGPAHGDEVPQTSWPHPR